MTSMAAAMALYRLAWRAAGPLAALLVRRRDARRGVPADRTLERFGWGARPAQWGDAGATLWIHGASVGECLSVLPLVELALAGRLTAQPDARVLLTTTTPAARQLLETRLASVPEQRAVCIFAPLDHPACVERFLETWKPDAGLWVESELWPTLIDEASKRHLAIGIVNARISPRSYRLWQLPGASGVAHRLMSKFSLVLCQDEANRRRFLELGATWAECASNLKFVQATNLGNASSISESTQQVNAIRAAIGQRPVWAAVSTHEGEEEVMVGAHKQLLDQEGDLLLVLIPRHPDRVPEIVEDLRRKFPSTSISLRSKNAVPSSSASIFVVDTLGETGIFFEAVKTVVMGGTFVKRGGHNPLEPLRAGCQVITGPHMENFSDIMDELQRKDSEIPVDAIQTLDHADESQLANALQRKLCGLVDEAKVLAQKQSLASLASISLSAHERKLRAWLSSPH